MSLPESIFHDLRYGVRMLWRNPGTTVVTVLALSLGIAVNTTVFTAHKAMIARPLDARDPGGMVNLALTRDSAAPAYTFSYPDFEAYRDNLHALAGLVAFEPARVTLSNAGSTQGQRNATAGSSPGRLSLFRPPASTAEFASVFVVSDNYFGVLGIQPIQGRSFDTMSASELAAAPSVVISENYWQRRFGGDPAILGKSLYLNGVPVTVIGIAPHDFVGTAIGAPAFWIPAAIEPLLHGDDRWLRDREAPRYRLFGRLAPGGSIAQARAEMNPIADRLRSQHDPHSELAKPATALIWTGSPFPLPLKQYGGLNLAIILIMAAAGMVLAVACANVGSLQLARARTRENELRTRISLGAGRARATCAPSRTF